jgi:RNA polymerase sigma factor (sigma-70 family)
MASGQLSHLLRHLHRLADAGGSAGRTDGQLLRGFVLRREEAAFAELVHRHGPMVLALCRRLLPQDADAEDAFQATFLVLARKAASIRKQESAANFLYGVARRIAMRVRVEATRRPAATPAAASASRNDPAAEAGRRELRAILDAELSRLPEKYRTPVVLCYFKGRSHAEAAGQLGWPEGTVKGRLARARDLLRGRLARRGVALSATALAVGLVEQTASARVPAALQQSAIQGACLAAAVLSGRVLALADGAMPVLVSRRPQLALLLLMALALTGTGAGLLGRPAEQGAAPAAEPGPVVAALPRTDRLGDPLPAGALMRLGTARFRQGYIVGRLVFAPDGKRLGSLGWDGTFRVWEAATGQELHRLDLHGIDGTALAFPPDGRPLALLAAGHGEVRRWDLPVPDTSSPSRAAPGRPRKHTVPLPPANWNCLALSPDGKTLAAGITPEAGQSPQLRLWEVKQGGEPPQLRDLGRIDGTSVWPFSSITFSADGKTVAARAWQQAPTHPLVLADVATATQLARLDVPAAEGREAALALAPDGRTLALGLEDRTLRLWDRTGKEVRRFEGHTDHIAAVAFSPDGNTLVSGGRDLTVRLWDVATGKELHCCRGHLSWVEAVAFSPDGRSVASGGQDYLVRLWDVATGKELRPQEGHQHWVICVAAAPDGKTAVTAGMEDTLRFWDLATGQQLRQLRHSRGIMAVAFAPDGKVLASGSFDRTVRLWDVATGQELRRLRGHEDGIAALAFSPDGKLLVSGSDDHTVRLWDTATGQELRQFRGHSEIVRAVAFAPDGQTVVSGSFDATMCQWDVTTGKKVRVFAGHSASVRAVALSPDGRALASGALTMMGAFQGAGAPSGPADFADALRLWNVDTGKEVRRFPGGPEPRAKDRREVAGVAFSPDGRTLAAAETDGGLVLYETASGQPRRRLEGHQGKTEAVAFSADGKRVVSIGSDLTALVWDATGRLDPGRPRRADLSPRQLEESWSALAGTDAARAWEAILVLGSSEGTPSFLRERLRPVPGVDERRLARLVADLDSDQFAERDRARAELEKLGESARAALRRALDGKPSAEVRRRVEALLDKLDEPKLSPERLRAVRALEALEQLATPDARRLVEELAGGAPEAWLTREAKTTKACLERQP